MCETGFIVTAIFDGDFRPHSKRDSFKRRYQHTMNQINSTYCRRAAMVLASQDDISTSDKVKMDVLNMEANKT